MGTVPPNPWDRCPCGSHIQHRGRPIIRLDDHIQPLAAIVDAQEAPEAVPPPQPPAHWGPTCLDCWVFTLAIIAGALLTFRQLYATCLFETGSLIATIVTGALILLLLPRKCAP